MSKIIKSKANEHLNDEDDKLTNCKSLKKEKDSSFNKIMEIKQNSENINNKCEPINQTISHYELIPNYKCVCYINNESIGLEVKDLITKNLLIIFLPFLFDQINDILLLLSFLNLPKNNVTEKFNIAICTIDSIYVIKEFFNQLNFFKFFMKHTIIFISDLKHEIYKSLDMLNYERNLFYFGMSIINKRSQILKNQKYSILSHLNESLFNNFEEILYF